MRTVPCLALLLLAQPTTAAPVTAIVLRGNAKTVEEAARQLQRWEEQSDIVGEFAKLQEGYPRIAESKSITGLKAGYHVVLLGFCPAEEAARQLELFRAVDTEVYSRPVDGPEDACPVVEKPWIVGAPRQVKAGERNTLTVATFYVGDPGSVPVLAELGVPAEARYQARQALGDGVAEPGFALAVLRDADGKVLEQRTLGDRCYAMEATRVDGKRLRVKGRCVTPDGASDDCIELGIWEMSWILEADDAIAVKERRGAQLPKVMCR